MKTIAPESVGLSSRWRRNDHVMQGCSDRVYLTGLITVHPSRGLGAQYHRPAPQHQIPHPLLPYCGAHSPCTQTGLSSVLLREILILDTLQVTRGSQTVTVHPDLTIRVGKK